MQVNKGTGNLLSKLDDTRTNVQQISIELEVSKKQVAQFQKQCEDFLVIIVQQKREADETAKSVLAKAEKLGVEEAEVKLVADAQIKKQTEKNKSKVNQLLSLTGVSQDALNAVKGVATGLTSGFADTLSNVLKIILAAFSIPEEPATPLPPPLIMVGSQLRPGLSSQAIASRIISRQSESGRQVGDVFADGPNNEETMELIRVEEIMNALKNESVVNVVIPPGVSVTGVGVGNLGAPVVIQGFTTTMGIGNGIIV
jgi:hypothetical protein